ncbi:hypothetical protein [Alteromonas sp. a30]|uniref:hypothetical protein n=1 Tax=Alteromonas sp. a30 TaxID=2730917 RepID=UPI0022829C64|nr:hypothetical protein [Alteromonas sp. a30]MCY7295839.1 hypothetical protein [Alteromonas sp. a30]
MRSGIGLFKGKIFLSAVTLFLASVQFSVSAKGEDSNLEGKEDAVMTFKSESHDLAIEIQGKRHFLALNKIQHWDVEVAQIDGEAFSEVEMVFDGGMPSHGHGMPTTPKVMKQTDSVFVIKGIKFSMPGVWELYFDIKRGDTNVRLTLEIELHYGKKLKILSARFS